jgi:hypothetical protein
MIPAEAMALKPERHHFRPRRRTADPALHERHRRLSRRSDEAKRAPCGRQRQELASVEAIESGFAGLGYICSPRSPPRCSSPPLRKPVLVEGPPGVGKTELAKTAAALLELPLVRLQCYEGLDEAKALYEWKYGKQLLYTQVLKEKLGDLLQGAEGLAESVERLHAFGDMCSIPRSFSNRARCCRRWSSATARCC